MEFEHEEALKDFDTSYEAMPLSIKTRIQNWQREKEKVDKMAPDDGQDYTVALRDLHVKSAIIAHEIQDFIEKDLAEEESTPNPNNMLSDEEKARATAAGLDENTATLSDIEAKEKEMAEKVAAEKADIEKQALEKADKEKAEQEAISKAAAEKEAAEKAEKEAKELAAKQEDDDDFIPGLM